MPNSGGLMRNSTLLRALIGILTVIAAGLLFKRCVFGEREATNQTASIVNEKQPSVDKTPASAASNYPRSAVSAAPALESTVVVATAPSAIIEESTRDEPTFNQAAPPWAKNPSKAPPISEKERGGLNQFTWAGAGFRPLDTPGFDEMFLKRLLAYKKNYSGGPFTDGLYPA